jgi:carboxylate-amine ligase
MGLEEEFLLADPAAGKILALAPRVLRGAGDDLDPELTRQQVETGTEPCQDLTSLRGELVRLRRTAAEAAAAEGAALVALGTSPVPVDSAVTDEPRYLRMMAQYGRTGREQLVCGCHLHVGVESRDEAVGAMDRMQAWLPCLIAISANSPYWAGEDTGYASYRVQVWDHWPSAGSTTPFGTAAGYDAAVDRLIASGVVLDRAMIYFDARPSERYSTLELRTADVCLSVDDAVLVAALGRALVETAAGEWARGEPEPGFRPELLAAARWRASRSGMDGDLVDLVTVRPVPAAELLDRLVDHVRPALVETKDLDLVRDGLARVMRRGTGARRQREVGLRLGTAGVLEFAAEESLVV